MHSDISSKTLKRIIDGSPVPMTLASPVFEDCPLMLVNDAFCALTGYARHEIIGRNCRFLQGNDSNVRARARMRYAIEVRQQSTAIIRNYRRDGAAFDNCVFLVPIFGASGAMLYLLGSQCDVTTVRPVLTPYEHAQLIDERLELGGRMLSSRDRLRVGLNQPCAQTIAELAEA